MGSTEQILSILKMRLKEVEDEVEDSITLLGGKNHSPSFLLGQAFALEKALDEITKNL